MPRQVSKKILGQRGEHLPDIRRRVPAPLPIVDDNGQEATSAAMKRWASAGDQGERNTRRWVLTRRNSPSHLSQGRPPHDHDVR